MIQRAFINLSKSINLTPKFLFSTVSVKLPKFETYRIDAKVLPTESQCTKEELLKAFYDMTVIRKMEIACDELYKQRLMRGFCHLYDGQEAVITGVEAAITFDDPIITAYRCHGHAYTRGITPYEVFAEMMAKRTGAAQGKGGSMHLYKKKTNYYGGNGIVGAQLPVGTGLAFALKYLKKRNVALAFYGDGASNQGQFAEAWNIAYLWKLPIIYICENNQYGMGTSCKRSSSNTKYYARGDQCPGLLLDGQNYFHIKEGIKWAKNYALENGPIFIEANTYRYHGHSMSDPGIIYRERKEVQNWRDQRDPITFLKKTILLNQFATEDELKATEGKIQSDIDAQAEKAKADPFPTEADLFTDILVNNDQHFARNIEFKDSFFPAGQKPY